MFQPTNTPVITVNEDVDDLSLHGDDGADAGDASDEGGGEEARAREVRDMDMDIGQSKLADLARRSLRIRRRVHLQLRRQRRRQQLQLEEARQVERLRRDKDILTNFMRLRLYETQSSFSSSDMASSLERSSDNERRSSASPTATPSATAAPGLVPAESESVPGDDGRREAGSVSGMSASTRGVADDAVLAGGAETSARSRRREDLRKILRQRRHRRRLMLLSCGEAGVEQYTDKTRNAAVVMGEKDIKLSLKQQRRALAAARGFSLPACAHPSGLTALARAHRRAGQARAALQLTEQALLLDPVHKAALLERSQCYQQLGQPRLALLDAEDALDLDKTNDAAFLHKARALYSMGHFEKALVMFHRGGRLRPEKPAFRTGIQRSREAIMNIIGCLPRDFSLSSCEKLLQHGYCQDDESSVGSTRRRRAAEMGALGALGAAGARLGAGVGGRAAESVLLWDDPWDDEEEDQKSMDEAQVGGSGLCESCNTAHQYVEVRPQSPLTAPARPLEEEARQIALILSVTNAHDSRNKHLREKLMVIPPTPPPAAGPAPARSRRPRSPQGAPGYDLYDLRPAESRPLRGQDDGVGVEAAVSRPGVDRVPPSLGRDASFLQRIARDPRLQGLPVSGLAEEAVRYLKGRQVFWQRRGPVVPGPGRPWAKSSAKASPTSATPTPRTPTREAR